MKSIIRIVLVLIIVNCSLIIANAQVAINSDGASPDASAMLDVTSTNKGILIPRMTTSEREAISNPTNSLLVFDTDENAFWYYNEAAWKRINAIDENGFSIVKNIEGVSSTLDASQTSSDGPDSQEDTWQSFKSNYDGYLSKIQMDLIYYDGGYFRVYEGTGTGGTLLGELTCSSLSGSTTFNLSNLYIPITSGSTYTFYLIDTVDSDFETYYAFHSSYTDGYADGSSSKDLWFKTYYEVKDTTIELNLFVVNEINSNNTNVSLSNIDTLHFADGTTQYAASYYNNQNVQLNSHWLSNDGNNEGISISNDGNTTLSGALTIGNAYTFPSSDGSSNQILTTNGSGTLSWATLSENLGDHTATQNIILDDNWISNDGGNEGIKITDSGAVGTGTSPTNGKLEINGSIAKDLIDYTYVNNSNYDVIHINYTVANREISVYASDRIVGKYVISLSDERIKDIKGISDSKKDLDILNQIEITDYEFIDKVREGNTKQKKVIAQQVAEVFPQAVEKQITEIIPDIYQTATMDENGWVTGCELPVTSCQLKVGEKVQILFDDKKELLEVLEVNENAFRVKQQATGNRQRATVFVYGRQVHDFHTVDYQAISMLNVSATQQLAKENETLKKRVADLEKQLEKVNQLEAKLEVLLNNQ